MPLYDCNRRDARASYAPGTRLAFSAANRSTCPVEAITDADVRAAQAGEPAAFRVIYEALSPVVLGYVAAKGVADPEGTTSDVFMAVFPRLRELHGGAAGLRTFVMSVAHAR